MKNPSLTLIIPVYNEEKTLLEVLKKIRILEKSCELEIIIINDGSKDNSKKILDDNKKLYTKIIHLEKNSGKFLMQHTSNIFTSQTAKNIFLSK